MKSLENFKILFLNSSFMPMPLSFILTSKTLFLLLLKY